VAYKSIIHRLMPPSRFDAIVHRITVPTMLIHGRNDGIVPYSSAERLAAQRRDWDFVTLDDCGHVPQMEDADTLIKLVDEFVASTQPA